MLELKLADLSLNEKFKSPVINFERKCIECGIPLHGYFLCKGKDILAEKYFAPFSSDSLHRMYSITKSFTSIAIGFLEQEGKISLDDKIADYFPEYTSDHELHPWIKELTIKNMLSMQTCFYKTTYKQYEEKDWTRSYFYVTPDHKSGTVFSYDTSSSQTLARLVEKLTGMQMLDYLRSKVLNEVGFSKEAYILTDGTGTSQGGSGLNCTLRDLAKVTYVCNHYGIVDGKELMPSEFLRKATSKIVPTPVQPTIDEMCGYGYFFWRTRKNSFVMYGMGGQLAICFPEDDFFFLTMADTMGNPAGLQIIYDSFYKNIYPLLAGNVDYNEECKTPLTFKSGTYYLNDNPSGFCKVILDTANGKLTILDSSNKEYGFSFRLNESIDSIFPNTHFKCRTYSHNDCGHLVIKCFLTDCEMGHIRMDIAGIGNSVTFRFECTSDHLFEKFKGCVSGYLR